MISTILLAQVTWEKIPKMLQGFIFAVVFMTAFVLALWLFGVDDTNPVPS